MHVYTDGEGQGRVCVSHDACEVGRTVSQCEVHSFPIHASTRDYFTVRVDTVDSSDRLQRISIAFCSGLGMIPNYTCRALADFPAQCG